MCNRGDLQETLEMIIPNVLMTNVPQSVTCSTSDCITPALQHSAALPLYLYPENSLQRTPTINTTLVKEIGKQLGLTFIPANEESNVCFINSAEVRPEFKLYFSLVDLLNYIYAVLHSPTYRERYKAFVKTDFSLVPYPKNTTTFWKLAQLGGELKSIHLLESPVVSNYITQYPVEGDNKVSKIKWGNGKVYINDMQYFDGVPLVAWQLYIGGYQPAQQWLKDRKDRELSFEDILHYQQIIVALTETDRLMKTIDTIEIE